MKNPPIRVPVVINRIALKLMLLILISIQFGPPKISIIEAFITPRGSGRGSGRSSTRAITHHHFNNLSNTRVFFHTINLQSQGRHNILNMVTTGKGGSGKRKPASSKEDDIEKTIAIILQHSKLSQSQYQQAKSTSSTTTRTTYRTTTKSTTNSQISQLKIINNVLSTLTSCFPLFVFSSAVIGAKRPQLLAWVNQGSIIPLMLGAVMVFMGMTLSTQDFQSVFAFTDTNTHTHTHTHAHTHATSSSTDTSTFSAVPIGVLCQYIIMPLTAYIIGSTILLPSHSAAFLGLILVGCSPGGTASNLVSLIAKANVALSVVLTSASTLLASLLTPLLVKIFVGSTIAVSGAVLCKSTAQVILGPIIAGMTIRKLLPKLADQISNFAPFAGVILVSLLCGGVVAQNSALFLSAGSQMNGNVIYKIIASVLALHTIGFTVGYLVPKKVFQMSEKTARTISIETGMQNSALAVVLAKSVVLAMSIETQAKNTTSRAALMSLAMLPGAMSATAHSCLGSALAVYWRFIDARRQGDDASKNNQSNDSNKNNDYSARGISTTTIIDETGGSGI